jgi:O-antigen ligase
VPLVVWPDLAEPYTASKWALLAVFAAAWLLVERLVHGSRGTPFFLRRTWPAWAPLAAIVLAGSLRNGLDWALEPLTARAAFVAVAFCGYWQFRRERAGPVPASGALLVSTLAVGAVCLVQVAGLDPLWWLPGGDHRSATFGNANMAAQFLGLASVFLLAAHGEGKSGRRRERAAELCAAIAVAYAVLVGARSAALALAAGVAALAGLGRLRRGRAARIGVAAAVLGALAALPAPGPVGPLSAELRQSKSASAGWRLAVWSDTLRLVADHPAGVGAGNFEHAFVPYALAGRAKPGEAIVFRSPHSEPLRLVAEEGIAGALLLLGLLGALARALHRSRSFAGWRSGDGALLVSCGAFLSVESLFQFPFELAFPALVSAQLVGLALASTDEPEAARASRRARARLADVLCALGALAFAVAAGRLVSARVLAGRTADAAALERACALDPRRLEACTQAAWLRGTAGDHAGLRKGAARVLERAPHYFPALKLLGEDLLAEGRTAEGCLYLRRYDALFGGRSSASEFVRARCQ